MFRHAIGLLVAALFDWLDRLLNRGACIWILNSRVLDSTTLRMTD